MLKISIVVPVYRTEAYLEQCVRSLLEQTYTNLEIILVDDGSPDRSGSMCDRFAAQDSRVRVIHKENGGLSSSRAAGIAAATGDYLTIVDSDDWIDTETFSQCIACILRDDADIVMYGYIKEYADAGIPVHLFDGDFSYDSVRSEELVHRRLVGLVGEELAHPERIDQLASTCMKLYRIDAARRGRIVSERETGTNEDSIFNLYALENCRISYLDRCFYHYRKTNEQSITTKHKPDLAEKWDTMYRYFREYVDQSGMADTYEEAYYNRIACGMIGLGLNEIVADSSIFQKARRLREIIRKPEYRRAFQRLELVYCPLKWKVFFLLCRWKAGFALAVLLMIIDILRSRMSA